MICTATSKNKKTHAKVVIMERGFLSFCDTNKKVHQEAPFTSSLVSKTFL